jgi:Ser-tRNA(Ala) deacylase AlaX
MESNLLSDKLYLTDSYLFESTARILKIIDEGEMVGIILDRTIFHPQGGGQPSDEGSINGVVIKCLSYDREKDLVIHKVDKKDFENSRLNEGDEVVLKIDKDKRILYARLHSAGHFIDILLSKLGFSDRLIPGKGFHFPEGSYVEYSGNLNKDEIPSLRDQLEKLADELIQGGVETDGVSARVYSFDEGKGLFKLPDYLPAGKPFRWIKLCQDDVGCPCGGTHVQHLRDIKGMKIPKITNKGKQVRISYTIA